MRRYETILIFRPTLGEDQITELTEKTSSIITDSDGTIIKLDKWGLKKLAYLIKKETQGYYLYIDYAGTPDAVAEIERTSKIDDRVLKYMTLKLADSCDPEAIKEEMAKTPEASEETAEETDSTKNLDDSDEIKTESIEAE